MQKNNNNKKKTAYETSDLSVSGNCLDGRLSQGLHLHEPLGGDDGLHVVVAAVAGAHVVGMLFDEEALMTNNKFRGMRSTGVNAKHLYQNLFWHFRYGMINDVSENCVLYYMADESETFTGDGVEDDFVLTGTVNEILKVTVNGTETTEYTYDSDTKTVTFDTAPADEAVIVISYK